MTAGDTLGADGPRKPYEQIVRTIVERIRITPENWQDVSNDTHPLLQRQP